MVQQLHNTMNYTYYFNFRGFYFSAGYFTFANYCHSMSACKMQGA